MAGRGPKHPEVVSGPVWSLELKSPNASPDYPIGVCDRLHRRAEVRPTLGYQTTMYSVRSESHAGKDAAIAHLGGPAITAAATG
jgi:hypothetical protein